MLTTETVSLSGARFSTPTPDYNSYWAGHAPREAFQRLGHGRLIARNSLDVSLCTGQGEPLGIIRRNQQGNDWDVLRLASRVAFQLLSSCDDGHVFQDGGGLALVSPDRGSGDHHVHPRSLHNICDAAHLHRDRTHTG